MRIREINQMCTVVQALPGAVGGVHESCLRAFNIVQKVKDLLLRGTPASVILELIDEIEYREDGLPSKVFRA